MITHFHTATIPACSAFSFDPLSTVRCSGRQQLWLCASGTGLQNRGVKKKRNKAVCTVGHRENPNPEKTLSFPRTVVV